MRRFLPGMLVAGCMLLLTAMTGCSGGDADQETTLQRIQRTGKVRIAYANEAPFGFKDLTTGEVTGEAPEIAREIFKRMGVTGIETTLADFGQLIPGLRAGRFDVIAAGMYITPERARQIRFSNPTYAVGEGFLVKAGNPKSLHSFADVLNNDTVLLGVVGGTVELTIAEQMKIPAGRIVVFPDNGAALAGLKAGRIDAFAGTALTVLDLLNKSPGADVERAEPFTQPTVGRRALSYGAFGFRLDDATLVDAFNKELSTFIGSEEHQALVAPFGFTTTELPGDVTVDQIIGESSGQ